jgi:dephospho-CoA kinase
MRRSFPRVRARGREGAPTSEGWHAGPVIRVGLTGGIGSGKSTVSQMLEERGAVVVDGDRIAREIVEPGEPALAAVVERFGEGILLPDGALDRAGLAALVFPDPEALAGLNAIMLPRIAERTKELVEQAERDGVAVLVQDMPLLVETGQHKGFDAVLVVESPREQRLDRLVGRGLAREDAAARMERQASDEQRRAVADFVIDNSGSQADTEEQVDRIWAALTARPPVSGEPASG